MARGQKQYTEEFKNTIIELYNAGKSLSELNREYAVAKSTITGWVKKSKPIAVDKNTIITAAEYQAMIKKNKQLEEEIEILKKAMGIFARK
jgi:transposase